MAESMSEAGSVPELLAEIQSGQGLSLAAAGRLFPGHRGGSSVDPSTVFRWVTKGTAAGGRTIKLEAVRAGTRWLTSRAAVARFVAALTDAATPDSVAPTSARPPRSATARRRAAAKAVAALEAMGA